jgi:hypothetical protein
VSGAKVGTQVAVGWGVAVSAGREAAAVGRLVGKGEEGVSVARPGAQPASSVNRKIAPKMGQVRFIK